MTFGASAAFAKRLADASGADPTRSAILGGTAVSRLTDPVVSLALDAPRTHTKISGPIIRAVDPTTNMTTPVMARTAGVRLRGGGDVVGATLLSPIKARGAIGLRCAATKLRGTASCGRPCG